MDLAALGHSSPCMGDTTDTDAEREGRDFAFVGDPTKAELNVDESEFFSPKDRMKSGFKVSFAATSFASRGFDLFPSLEQFAAGVALRWDLRLNSCRESHRNVFLS